MNERHLRPTIREFVTFYNRGRPAAGLGLMERVKDYFANAVPPKPEEITNAFWCACHGGQRKTAEYLLVPRLTGSDTTN